MLISWADLTQATHFAEFTKSLQIHPTWPALPRAPQGQAGHQSGRNTSAN